MSITYRLVQDENQVQSVVALFPNEAEPIRVADSSHPHWDSILHGLVNSDPGTYALFDVWGGIKAKFKSLSDRVDYDGENIRFDGDIVHSELAGQIQRFLEAGESDWEPLAKFWEKIAQNPSEHSKENLYRWLKTHAFTITMDGDIVGYKGVRKGNVDAKGEQVLESIHTGPAIVDGVAVNGHVPNRPGSVITMPRADVTADPRIGCHVGLHVGTWDYASGFGSVVLEVHVNPRDVVSVPTDCGDAKMRTSKYTVVQVINEPYEGAVLSPAEDYYDEDDYETEWIPDVGYRF
jgi:hypothetical protein